jgi:hypothetical protein
VPIDPSIPLAAQGPRFNSLGDSFMKAFQMRDQIESSRALREQREAIAEDRRAQTKKRERDAADQAAVGEAFSGGFDRVGVLGRLQATAPHLVPDVTKLFDDADKRAADVRRLRDESTAAETEYFGSLAAGVKAMGYSLESAQTALAHAKAAGYDDADQLLGQIQKDPTSLRTIVDALMAKSKSYAPKPTANTPQVVGPGGTLVDDQGTPLFTAPPREDAPTAGSFEDYIARVAAERGRTVKQLSPYDIEQARKKWSALDDQPRQPAEPRPLTQTAEAAMIARLAGTWDKANANSQELVRQSSMMRTAIERFDADPNAASQAVLSTFNKILDPQSVVRESEYARSAQGLSLIDRIKGFAERLQKGGAGVPKTQLQSMASMAEEFVKNSKDATGGLRKRLSSTADRYNIPHDLIFTDTTLPASAQPSTPSAPSSTGMPSYQDYLNSRKKGGG